MKISDVFVFVFVIIIAGVITFGIYNTFVSYIQIEKYLNDYKDSIKQILSLRDDGKYWTAVIVLK